MPFSFLFCHCYLFQRPHHFSSAGNSLSFLSLSFFMCQFTKLLLARVEAVHHDQQHPEKIILCNAYHHHRKKMPLSSKASSLVFYTTRTRGSPFSAIEPCFFFTVHLTFLVIRAILHFLLVTLIFYSLSHFSCHFCSVSPFFSIKLLLYVFINCTFLLIHLPDVVVVAEVVVLSDDDY